MNKLMRLHDSKADCSITSIIGGSTKKSIFELLKQYDLIVNTTGSSLYNEFPCKEQLLKELFKNSKYAFDVSYGINSKFLQLAKKYNLTCRDGMQMLLWQGVLSFELFFNIKNKQEEIKKYMQEGLSLGLRINS